MNDLDNSLSRNCPHCGAEPGIPCRSKFGKECEWPHQVRRPLSEQRRQPVRALCCECGNLRTVAASYRRGGDQNHSRDDNQHSDGWRMTDTLRCAACKASTRHAILRDNVEPKHRDGAELRLP